MSLFRHYKNKLYRYRGEVRHSETLGLMSLYDCLYENEQGKTWVRPHSLFFSDVEIDGITQKRFRPVKHQIQFSNSLCPLLDQQMTTLAKSTFTDFKPATISTRLSENSSQIAIHTLHLDGDFVGFKIGYGLSEDVFYSWLGAIEPQFRGLGLGRILLETQHEWCRNQKYKYIQTKTMNQWKSMLILNIKCGFSITGVETNPDGQTKILLSKPLEQL